MLLLGGFMSIKINKERNGTHTVLLVKSVRKPGAKYPSTVTLKSFGKYEDLIKQDPDIIEKLKEEYDIKNKLLNSYVKVSLSEVLDIKLNYNKNVMGIFETGDKLNSNPYFEEKPIVESSCLNIGYLILNKLFNELKLNNFFNNIQEETKIKFSISEAVRLHVFSRILFPDSVVQSNKGKNRFYKGFDVDLIESYRVLDVLYEHRYELQKHIFNEVNKKYKRNINTILFDETNYYFSQEEPEGLKQKGVSKEHQLTPIVQFALMIEDIGIPLCFDLFEGNSKDSTMFPPLMKMWKEDLNQKQTTTFVADKGNNCSGNNIMIDNNKDFYVFAQRVKGSKATFADWVLEEKGYEYIGESYKYKERIIKTTYNRQEKQENGKWKIVEIKEIEEKQVAFWSQNFANRDRAKREANIKTSQLSISNPCFFKMEEGHGRNRYVEINTQNKETGEITSKLDLQLNQDKIDNDAKYDGYYAIITNNLNLSKEDVISTYRKQPKIEEMFKITKSLFRLRPVYLYNQNHIRAHFLIGYVSLVLLTLLHKTIIDTIQKEAKDLKLNISFSYERLVNVLRELEVIKLDNNIYKLNIMNNDILLVTKILGIYLTRINYKKEMLDTLFL
jgi:transposase